MLIPGMQWNLFRNQLWTDGRIEARLVSGDGNMEGETRAFWWEITFPFRSWVSMPIGYARQPRLGRGKQYRNILVSVNNKTILRNTDGAVKQDPSIFDVNVSAT